MNADGITAQKHNKCDALGLKWEPALLRGEPTFSLLTPSLLLSRSQDATVRKCVRQAIQFHFIGLNAAIHLLPITSTQRWRPATINWQISTWPTTTTSCSWSWELTSWIHCSHYGLPTRSRTTRAADRRSTGGRGTTAAPTVNTHRRKDSINN